MNVPDWSHSLLAPWPAPAQVGAGAAVVIVALTLVGAARIRHRNRTSWGDLGDLRRLGWGPAAVTILGTFAVAAVLSLVPALRWGWWPALGGWGTPILGQHSAFGPGLQLVVASAASAVFVWSIPAAAAAEEDAWRAGSRSWTPARRVVFAVLFSAAHVMSGVPIAVALSFTVSAARFTWVAVHAPDGVQAAAREHAAFNVLAVAGAAGVCVARVVWF